MTDMVPGTKVLALPPTATIILPHPVYIITGAPFALENACLSLLE